MFDDEIKLFPEFSPFALSVEEALPFLFSIPL